MDNRTLPIAQAAAGDQEAFALLVRRMMPLIHDQMRRLGTVGVDDEDLVQEALMGLLAAVRTYRPDGGAAFTTYATTCIRNRLLTAVRRNGIRMDHEQSLEDSPEVAVIHDDPAHLLMYKEELDDLLTQMRIHLTAMEYQVLMLWMRGFSYTEIAARLGITAKAVDNAIQRIRRKIGKSGT